VIAGWRVQVFTRRLDARSGTDRVASHAGLDHPSLAAVSADDTRRAVRPETDMVAVDEAHFFGADLTGGGRPAGPRRRGRGGGGSGRDLR
jgi:thymidine kinase